MEDKQLIHDLRNRLTISLLRAQTWKSLARRYRGDLEIQSDMRNAQNALIIRLARLLNRVEVMLAGSKPGTLAYDAMMYLRNQTDEL